MRQTMKILMTLLIFIWQATSFADDLSVNTPAQQNKLTTFLLFQVIQDQFVLDNSNIRSASLVERGEHFIGLKVELKKTARAEIEKITTAGIGKPANLIFNKKVISTSMIQSALGGSLLITGLTKEEAQTFLLSLAQIEKKHLAAKQVERMPVEPMPKEVMPVG